MNLFYMQFWKLTRKISMVQDSVVDPDRDPVRSALFGRISIVTEKTDPGSIKGSQNKGYKTCFFIQFFIIIIIYNNF